MKPNNKGRKEGSARWYPYTHKDGTMEYIEVTIVDRSAAVYDRCPLDKYGCPLLEFEEI